MDSFMNIAKQGFEAYQEHQKNEQQSEYHKTGGAEYNPPQYSGHGPDLDQDEVVRNAQHHSSGSGDSSLFSSAMGFLNQNKSEHDRPLDEEAVQQSHRQAYHEGSASNMDASSMGSAAALQVLKSFTSGGSSGEAGGSKSQLISMAMAEASKLFDKSGGGSGGNKQDAVNGAAMTVVKLLVQSKFSGAVGSGNSGGLGGLMTLASKFT
ncbi:beta-flanking protein [Dentipellis sp. KUC8613]|nr:beta-flanking protein [Dentipellis sp. KUC8613]